MFSEPLSHLQLRLVWWCFMSWGVVLLLQTCFAIFKVKFTLRVCNLYDQNMVLLSLCCLLRGLCDSDAALDHGVLLLWCLGVGGWYC